MTARDDGCQEVSARAVSIRSSHWGERSSGSTGSRTYPEHPQKQQVRRDNQHHASNAEAAGNLLRCCLPGVMSRSGVRARAVHRQQLQPVLQPPLLSAIGPPRKLRGRNHRRPASRPASSTRGCDRNGAIKNEPGLWVKFHRDHKKRSIICRQPSIAPPIGSSRSRRSRIRRQDEVLELVTQRGAHGHNDLLLAVLTVRRRSPVRWTSVFWLVHLIMGHGSSMPRGALRPHAHRFAGAVRDLKP
jgi:hypothetical protein